ncbi:MAG: iron uptake porin [Scytolyngbya sp. HA4215-MV1]|nr:iron uptake porin [Scytolyngbya sp. HA4215-MV1]
MEQDPVLESTWMAQITSVSQLSDVNQSDWAFQALQSLVDRYGCIVGYPNQSYRGNRALSRYEFAAGLNACLEQVNGLLASGSASLVQKEDLDNLQKLQEEFAAELATVRGRVDALEVRTTTLEQQQFSTTTKLHGEVIFAVAGVATGQDADNRDIARITTFSDRVRLNLDTSFTGKDLLRTRLQALNSNSFFSAAGTGTQLPEGTLAFNAELDDEGPESNGVGLDTLYYQFPIGKKARVTLFANEGEVDDFTNTVNPFLDGDDGASGALSKFGSRNSVYYFVPQGTGIGFQYQFSDQIELSLGYLSSTASNPSAKRGLFNGSYGAIAQLSIQPSDRISLGFTYVNAYNNLGEDLVSPGTGSQKANLGLVTDEPVISNAYGIEASVQITPNFFINGWVGYTRSRVVNVGDADIWNYAVALAFPDLGGRGNLAGILVGMEPKVTGADRAIADAFTEVVSDDNEDSARDRNTSLHVEVFYTLALSDNIAITPGLIWLTAPNHDNRNDDIVIGVIRTTFFF